jgi:hypothetical protein
MLSAGNFIKRDLLIGTQLRTRGGDFKVSRVTDWQVDLTNAETGRISTLTLTELESHLKADRCWPHR